jgi:hypothetical protein
LHNDQDYLCIFRDNGAGLEYIRNSKELCAQGLYVELDAFKYHVFIDFREVRDNTWRHYARIAENLNGRGVPSIEEALKEMLLQPLHRAFRELVNGEMFRHFMEARITQPQAQLDQHLMEEIEKKIIHLVQEARRFSGGERDGMMIAREIRRKLEAVLYLPILTRRYPRFQPKGVQAAAEYLHKRLTDSTATWATLFGWVFVHALGKVVDEKDYPEQSRTWIDGWMLDKTIFGVLRSSGLEEDAAGRSMTAIKMLTSQQRWFEVPSLGQKRSYAILELLFEDEDFRRFLQINRYQDAWWFNKEAFEEMLWWLMMVAALTVGSDPLRPVHGVIEELERCYLMIQEWQRAEEKSGYQVEKLLSALRE